MQTLNPCPSVFLGIVIKVENSNANTVFWEGVIRPNFILDIKTDRNWEGVIRPTEKSGELKANLT